MTDHQIALAIIAAFAFTYELTQWDPVNDRAIMAAVAFAIFMAVAADFVSKEFKREEGFLLPPGGTLELLPQRDRRPPTNGSVL